MACVGVSDDERPVVDNRRGGTLLGVHARAHVVLVLIGGYERANDARSLFRNLAQWIARKVGAGILGNAALGRRCPTAQVDAFNTEALDGNCLSGRVGTEGRDRFAISEQLTKARIEPIGRFARYWIVSA